MYYKIQLELNSLDTSSIWGFEEISQIFEIEFLYKGQADFSLKFSKSGGIINFFKFLSNLFRKDLEIFIVMLDFYKNLTKTACLAPRFFNVFLIIFSGFNWFRYIEDLRRFVDYEEKRQKVYLPLQIGVLDKNLALVEKALGLFISEDRPATYFLLVELHLRLTKVSLKHRALILKRPSGYRFMYSRARQIIINYSDIVNLIEYRLKLENYGSRRAGC